MHNNQCQVQWHQEKCKHPHAHTKTNTHRLSIIVMCQTHWKTVLHVLTSARQALTNTTHREEIRREQSSPDETSPQEGQTGCERKQLGKETRKTKQVVKDTKLSRLKHQACMSERSPNLMQMKIEGNKSLKNILYMLKKSKKAILKLMKS